MDPYRFSEHNPVRPVSLEPRHRFRYVNGTRDQGTPVWCAQLRCKTVSYGAYFVHCIVVCTLFVGRVARLPRRSSKATAGPPTMSVRQPRVADSVVRWLRSWRSPELRRRHIRVPLVYISWWIRAGIEKWVELLCSVRGLCSMDKYCVVCCERGAVRRRKRGAAVQHWTG